MPTARSRSARPGDHLFRVAKKFHNQNIRANCLTSLESFPTVLVKGPDLGKAQAMELTKIAGDDNCKDGDCPTVYRTDRGTIAVQGERLSHPTPAHEAIVEIPVELLAEAARALGG